MKKILIIILITLCVISFFSSSILAKKQIEVKWAESSSWYKGDDYWDREFAVYENNELLYEKTVSLTFDEDGADISIDGDYVAYYQDSDESLSIYEPYSDNMYNIDVHDAIVEVIMKHVKHNIN